MGRSGGCASPLVGVRGGHRRWWGGAGRVAIHEVVVQLLVAVHKVVVRAVVAVRRGRCWAVITVRVWSSWALVAVRAAGGS
jgi:hypothetical protein